MIPFWIWDFGLGEDTEDILDFRLRGGFWILD